MMRLAVKLIACSAAVVAGVATFLLLTSTNAMAACGGVTYDVGPGNTGGCGDAVPIAGSAIVSAAALAATSFQLTRTYRAGSLSYDASIAATNETPPLVRNTGGLFPNQMKRSLEIELSLADRLGVEPAGVGSSGFDSAISSGTVKWAVREDDSLVVVPKFVSGLEVSHSVLTRGAPVRAAGEADIAGSSADGYFALEINNHSGHFRPSLDSLQVGKDAFEAAGVFF